MSRAAAAAVSSLAICLGTFSSRGSRVSGAEVVRILVLGIVYFDALSSSVCKSAVKQF